MRSSFIPLCCSADAAHSWPAQLVSRIHGRVTRALPRRRPTAADERLDRGCEAITYRGLMSTMEGHRLPRSHAYSLKPKSPCRRYCKVVAYHVFQEVVPFAGMARLGQLPRWARSWALLSLADLTSGAKLESGSHVCMKGCWKGQSSSCIRDGQSLTCSRSCALALFSGSTFKAKYRKSLKTEDRLCSSRICGVPYLAIKYSARSGDSVRYGGSPSIISIAMIPRLQMSTFRPYSLRVTTSGAIQ